MQDGGTLALAVDSAKLLDGSRRSFSRALITFAALVAAAACFLGGGLVGRYLIPRPSAAVAMVTMPLVKMPRNRTTMSDFVGAGGNTSSGGSLRGAAFADCTTRRVELHHCLLCPPDHINIMAGPTTLRRCS